MTKIIFSLIGMALAYFIIVSRKMIGDLIGDPPWVAGFGGIHNFLVIVAVMIFFWSFAELTGTTHLLFYPLTFLIPQF
jgi:uncharacterized membrane protein